MWNKIQKIYIGTQKVRPPYKREPNANTIWYYPLTSSTTVNDQSWNSRNLSNNGSRVTFWTYKWVDCAYFTGNSSTYMRATINAGQTALTLCCWFYFIQYNTSYGINLIFLNSRNFGIWIAQGNNNRFASSSLSWFSPNVNLTSDSWWALWTITFTWTSEPWALYYNWVLAWTRWTTWWSATIASTLELWSSNWNNFFQWGLSEVIVENRAWTDEEVLGYYNQTKSKYWIS